MVGGEGARCGCYYRCYGYVIFFGLMILQMYQFLRTGL